MTGDVADTAAAYAGVAGNIGAKRGGDQTGFQIAFGRCESPIEQAYCLTMFQVPEVRAVPDTFSPRLLPTLAGAKPRIVVFAQQPVLRYRADFLLVGISPTFAEPRFVIIECDGEAYHSAREQRRRDAARQAELAGTGFTVARFTGAELFRNPERVAYRTLDLFHRHGWRASEVRRWISNRRLRDAMSELRVAASRSQEPA